MKNKTEIQSYDVEFTFNNNKDAHLGHTVQATSFEEAIKISHETQLGPRGKTEWTSVQVSLLGDLD